MMLGPGRGPEGGSGPEETPLPPFTSQDLPERRPVIGPLGDCLAPPWRRRCVQGLTSHNTVFVNVYILPTVLYFSFNK